MKKIPTRDLTPQPVSSGEISLYEGRRKFQVREITGFFERIRVLSISSILILFLVLPWLTWNGRQALLFDLQTLNFDIFGWTFQPQDFIYLSWMLIIAALSLFVLTVFAGRVYCGYVCPQTVWTKIFLWIERFAEGSRSARLRLDRNPWAAETILRRALKHTGWMLVGLATGIAFNGYFSPVRQMYHDLVHFNLGFWQVFSVFFFAAATYINAGWMREQVCMYMCPYGRLQSVMVDRDTLIISYDAARGEPRGSRKRGSDPKTQGLGDCVSCNLCVQVCPNGIDIRQGLQLECIQCGACIDACNSVMKRLGYKDGLIRYTSESALEAGGRLRLFRPRVLISIAVIAALCGLFLYSLASRVPLTVEAIHDRNHLYRESTEGSIENSYIVKVMNESQRIASYRLAVEGSPAIHIESATPTLLTLKPGEMLTMPLTLEAEAGQLSGVRYDIKFVVTDAANASVQRVVSSRFLAPALH